MTAGCPKRKISLFASLVLVVLTLSLFVSETSGKTLLEQLKRFKLFAKCQPIKLLVEGLPPDASKINLTRESIQVTAESRLRSARLYHSEARYTLYINVNIVGPAYSVRLDFKKPVRDFFSNELFGMATTWDTGSIGLHGSDGRFILSSISQLMDHFLVEYLRVNEEVCQKR